MFVRLVEIGECIVSKFKMMMIGLIITAFSTCSIAWIKQVQQKHLDEAQLQRVEIEATSKDPNPESLQRARQKTIVSLKKLEQVPAIPLIAEPSKDFQTERHQLSTKIKQIDKTLAIIEQGER